MNSDASVLTRPLDTPPAPSDAMPPQRLRYPDGQAGWLVTRYADARKILADPRFDVRPPRCPIDDGGALAAVAGPLSAGDILRLDGAEHLRVRRALTRHFTVARVSEHRALIERIVAERIDALEVAGPPVDLMESFARPLASIVICELMGLPEDGRAQLEQVTEVWVDFTGTTAEQKLAATQHLDAYAREVVARMRAQPNEAAGLLGDLIAEGGWTDEELAGVVFLLFSAGYHTVASTIALSIDFLLSERAWWEALDPDDPEAIAQTVEELLRYQNISSLLVTVRTAHEDVEIDGVVIRAGEAVTMQSPVPSGDPEALANPEQFDPSRQNKAHLAFGHGRHVCLGQHLARLELDVLLVALKRRLPTLRLAPVATDEEDGPRWKWRAGQPDVFSRPMPGAW
jgi:cytochrome P450